MYDYVKNLLDELPDNLVGTAKTPASNHLFTTTQYCTKLMQKKAFVPPSSHKATIPEYAHLTRHPNSSGVFMYKGKKPRHGQLQEAPTHDAVTESHKRSDTNDLDSSYAEHLDMQSNIHDLR